ncbi:MAG: hydroxyacylglutathione hydrolase [Lysobacteraceae bacterium]|nr:MAG: hydroxyacylglutathione hydrolase [Xanthomonadaceae bacterium]
MSLQPVPAFEDNYIWLLRDTDGRALVVDPGDAAPVLAELGDGPAPHAILLTHHHHDHIGGVEALLAHWPGLEVAAPRDDRIAEATRRVDDGDSVAVGPWRFEVLSIPGHTRTHVAYLGHGLLFCGDTLFSLGCGRMFEGTPAQMHASLQRLARLPGDTLACGGHEYTAANAAFALAVDPGNPALQARASRVRELRAGGKPSLPSRMAEERACNPFLRCGDAAIRDAAERRAGRHLPDAVEVFAELRGWKDSFRA